MSVLEKRVAGLTVRIDRDSCIGTGACVKAAPEVFELDDRQVVTFTEGMPETDAERVRDACAACPVFALEAVSG
jgi:ferredoxin